MSVTLYSVTFKKAYSPNQGPCSQSGESAAFEAEPAIQLVAQGYAAFVSSDDAAAFADQVLASTPTPLIGVDIFIQTTNDGSDPQVVMRRLA